jgi:4-alpha-glucanotransferase
VPETAALHALAEAMGVRTSYTDGLCKDVHVSNETLVRVCAALGAPIHSITDAADALRQYQRSHHASALPPVLVAWNGALDVHLDHPGGEVFVTLEDGSSGRLEHHDGRLRALLPHGYHRITTETATSTIIAAPVEAYRRPGDPRSWGVGAHLAALRSSRSRSLGDLADLESLCWWLHGRGADLITLLPLLPTFNTEYPEPSPYSPVSRLFWSELMLDLGAAHRLTGPPAMLDVMRADAEVRAALAGQALPGDVQVDPELARYARFRGAQHRMGRNWRDWPEVARHGTLHDEHVDASEEQFHLLSQWQAGEQLGALRERLDGGGFRLGLDLTVGVHSDGYDTWSRPGLFANGVSVGAPPDAGFPSGQDWGFNPVLPAVSRAMGHEYLAASIAHQMKVAGVLRVDHIMALTRLYWIPHGMGLHEGTYVSYPAEELFAILTLESARHRCEVVGENLGTVPEEINVAMPRHRIWGMYLAQFTAAGDPEVQPPAADQVALVGTHDTPTFAGWMTGADIVDRLQHNLMAANQEQTVREERAAAVQRLALRLGVPADDPRVLFKALLRWLGHSRSTLVMPWLEDLWLEVRGVNLPGTPSFERPNWQRPMSRLIDDIMNDPLVAECIGTLQDARTHAHP